MPAALSSVIPADVTALLRDEIQHRRSALVLGPGGSGKTTLLRLLVHELGERAAGEDGS